MSAEKPLTPEPLSDDELSIVRLWTNIGDQSDKGKLCARGLLLTIDRLKARERKLVNMLNRCASYAEIRQEDAWASRIRAAIEENDDGSP